MSRLGLVAAVADRHRWFRRLPLPDSLSEGHVALRDLLDEAATSYLAELGSLEPATRESIVTAARQVEQAAHSRPVELEQWRRFAALLRYAAEASIKQDQVWDESLHAPPTGESSMSRGDC